MEIIDQTGLPHRVDVMTLTDLADAARAIKDMHVRGAPLIGVAAAYGVALAMRADPSDAGLAAASEALRRTRPTAVNLVWALEAMRRVLGPLPPGEREAAAYAEASAIADADVAVCHAMATHGVELIRALSRERGGRPVNILTHCNAGWLAAVEWGHRHRADLRRAPRRRRRPRLRRRDAAAQPGRGADRVGAGALRRAAHGGGRQPRRPPDAARPRRLRDGGHRPHHRDRRRLQQGGQPT